MISTASTTINKTEPHLWVSRHADYLYAFAFTRINDEELARDLVQETFLAALERIGGFEARSSERTWLTGILKNKIIDVYRKRSSGLNRDDERREKDNSNAFFDDEDGSHWRREHVPQEFKADPEDPLMRKEFEKILQQCMKKLPALWLSVFTMKHVDEENTETVCGELNITASNFWVIIHRAKLNLRACLQKNWI